MSEQKHDEYVAERKKVLETEFDENTKKISELQSRQTWLQGAFAELSEAEKAMKPKDKKEPK
jgi:hypothetical protein